MSLADALRGRMATRTIVSEPGGSPEEMRRARLERQRARHEEGIRRRWDEIPADRLVRSRYWLEDTETGNLYREFHGDPAYAEPVVAWYVGEGGSATMLEPANPPSRAELEKRRAEKEQRRLEKEAATRDYYDALRRGAGR